MLENVKKPVIRFAEFDDAWEQRKLGKIADFNPNSVLPDSFEYVDLESVVGTDMISHRTEKRESAPSRAQRLAKQGDVFYQTVRPYQRNNYLFELPYDNFVFSTGYAQMRPHIDSRFLFSRIQEDRFVKNVLDRCTGTSYPAINASDLAEIEIRVPLDRAEQERIGITFKNLDNLITLHQRKCDKLVSVKKAMLEKMFPKNGSNVPEIRFGGFTDPWEQRKWSDTVDISTEMVDPKCGDYDDLPHVAPGNIESFTGRVFDNVKTVKEENLISGKFHFYDGDIIYGKINPQLGKYAFMRFEGLTSADAYVLNSKNGLDQKFLFALIQSDYFYRYTVSVSKRSGMPKINRDELNSFTYNSPITVEQKRIGELFLSIDNLITLHHRKLEKLTNVKKSMLDKMFI
ncbi:type I restriction enzyme, S subunit [Sphaerochaeta associata]|uniref:Restriction endonuclease subunit S n=1 Tax=Sphaerochaeta associata TaxID=1129264 RepID=A0ABY4D6Z8_9SPIR|nr:restriction endonuclease subunit S [Sphaerochaeta associata]UOM50072.1 restriction endonuclease subunit S [Sphaerochaeta associata]SMP54492.1 type I restriction enzyme, S subunit [Sphaerochaeta associata]